MVVRRLDAKRRTDESNNPLSLVGVLSVLEDKLFGNSGKSAKVV